MSLFGRIVQSASHTLAGWFESYAYIIDKSGATIRPKANPLQREVSEVIDWCESVNRPIRLILLKPRQKGCSTVSVGALFRFLKIKKLRACIIGSGYEQSSNLFKILKVYAKNDSWSLGGLCKVLQNVARWQNGSECGRLTANNPEAGRSGTYQVIIGTEVARWGEEGVANAAEVLSGLLKTMGHEPGTMAILESTAAGAYGDYYERYQNAVTFEEAQAGKPGYIKIFMPWFVFEDSRREPESEQINSVDDLTGFEREYMDEWELDLSQMAWMRWALREECNGDWDRFQQDYPSDEKTAFLNSGRARFAANGIKYQEKLQKQRKPQYGALDRNLGDTISWSHTSEKEALWMRWEEPRQGMRYLVSADQMTGASQNGGDDPDSHAVKVIRAGYVDNANGRWVPPAIVMSMMLYEDGPRLGNWFDIDILTEHVRRASLYYGDCIIVPEVNMDRGMIELLKLEGAHIYKRQVFNKRTSEWMDAYGWLTTKTTRNMMIEHFAKAIREAPKQEQGEGFEVNCPFTIDEIRSFVRKENGREEAAKGAHDDQVIAAMIGLMCVDVATPYVLRHSQYATPRDLRDFERGGDAARGGTFGV